MRPPTACSTNGCAGLASERGLCVECLKTAASPVRKFISKFANAAYHHLYNSKRWRDPNTGLRALVLRRDPVCVVCKRKASVIADHIRDHRGDERLFFDPKNVRGICKGCHDAKTGSQHGAGNREPDKQGLVDGKVVDHAPPVDTPSTDLPDFDFLAAATKRRS